MADPVGITLGAVALFAPIFNAYERFYKEYTLTREFGDDYILIQLSLDAQYARLQQISRRRFKDLPGYQQVDLNDETDAVASVVVR